MNRFFPVLAGLVACGSNPAPSEPVSFKDEVMPIVAESCALTACHASAQQNLAIHLTSDPTQVYQVLQSASSYGPRYVVAGKPGDSLVMRKLDGTQKTLSGCEKAGCGLAMPPSDPLAKEDRDLIRQWITEGAKNN